MEQNHVGHTLLNEETSPAGVDRNPWSDVSDDEFLHALGRRDIQVTLKQDKLHISAAPNAINQDLRQELARRKTRLLALLQAGPATKFNIQPGRAKPGDKIRQTPAQQGLWLIDHFDKGNVAYNIPEAFVFDGPLDLGLLQSAIDKLLSRHHVLRTALFQEKGVLLQQVSDSARVVIGVTDLRHLALEESKRQTEQRIQEQSREPFDLTNPPLIRFHVFRLPAERSVIFLNIHHIISDRGSLTILREDLFQLYQAELGGTKPELRGGSVQFADYADWAFEQLSTPALKLQVEYWKQKLAGASKSLELPHSKAMPEARSAWGATLPVAIDPLLQQALTLVGQKASATPFMVYLAAYALLLYQLSDMQNFCIGTPFTHRKQLETERTIGLFVNMLAIHCQPQPQLTFLQLIEQVRSTALEAYENSDVPFQTLLRELKPDRRSRQSPIFQVIFIYESLMTSEVRTIGPSDHISVQPGTARYDLTLHLSEREDVGITGFFEYCTDLFADRDIKRFARQFDRLLRAIAEGPTVPLGQLKEPFANEDEEAADVVTDAALNNAGSTTSPGLLSAVRRFFTQK